MATDRSGQFLDDHESLQALVDVMPDKDREEYRSYGALTLDAVFPNRRMVVYTLRDKEPANIQMVLFGDIEMERIKGPTATIQDNRGDIGIGVVPTRYRDRDLFVHIPQNFVFKWKGKRTSTGQVQFVPHYAVLVKARSKEIHQIEGHTYCVTLKTFWERFPHLKNDIRY
jgi:hypothetical protein